MEKKGLKTFKEYKATLETSQWENFEMLNEEENLEARRIYEELSKYSIEEIDEGMLSQLIGGVSGFVIGPAIGRVIARALGVEKGILYDMFTSRLVSAALGAAVAKEIGGKFGNRGGGSDNSQPFRIT